MLSYVFSQGCVIIMNTFLPGMDFSIFWNHTTAAKTIIKPRQNREMEINLPSKFYNILVKWEMSNREIIWWLESNEEIGHSTEEKGVQATSFVFDNESQSKQGR